MGDAADLACALYAASQSPVAKAERRLLEVAKRAALCWLAEEHIATHDAVDLGAAYKCLLAALKEAE